MLVFQRALIVLVLLGSCRVTLADDVFVQAGRRQGQGITRARGNDCFVLSAAHLFAGDSDSITLLDANRRQLTGYVERTYNEDLAIVKVEGPGSSLCEDSNWPNRGSVTELLRGQGQGVLRSLNEDGSRSQISVRIVEFDDRYITVSPVDGRAIIQTWSGSTLFVGSEIAGLLVSVDATRGKVYRREYINDLMRGFFSIPARSDEAVTTTIELDTWEAIGGGSASTMLIVDGHYEGVLRNFRERTSLEMDLRPGIHTFQLRSLYFGGSSIEWRCEANFITFPDEPTMKLVLLLWEPSQGGRITRNSRVKCGIFDPQNAERERQRMLQEAKRK